MGEHVGYCPTLAPFRNPFAHLVQDGPHLEYWLALMDAWNAHNAAREAAFAAWKAERGEQ